MEAGESSGSHREEKSEDEIRVSGRKKKSECGSGND